jgi:hypothetical protein
VTPTTPEPASSTQREAAVDLAAAVQRVLAASPEPLTLSRIRARLTAPFSSASQEELADFVHRQVAANVYYQFPRYRSQHDRFWDRPMPVHIAALLRITLEKGPLPWSHLRRKLPGYAQAQAEPVLNEQIEQGVLHRHPRRGPRGGDLFGLQPPDPRDYLRGALADLFRDLQQLGFTESQLRAAALEVLHDEEWSPTRPETVDQPEGLQEQQSTASPSAAAEGSPAEMTEQIKREQTEPQATGPDGASQ